MTASGNAELSHPNFKILADNIFTTKNRDNYW